MLINGSPLALALAAARAAAARRDVPGLNAAYRKVVGLAHGSSPGLRKAIAAEHVSKLRVLGDATGALTQCDEYLDAYGEDVMLRLLRAETTLVRDDHTRLDTDLAAVRKAAGGLPLGKSAAALLSRLEGLAEGRHGRLGLAAQHLHRSRQAYAELGDMTAVAVIDDDLRLVAALQGAPPATVPTGTAQRSPHARLIRSEELRMVGRYEEALAVLEPALAGPLDPSLRFSFLEARVRLLRLLRADDEHDAGDKLMQALYDAAEESARPHENLIAAQRLQRDGAAVLDSGDHHLQHIRWLIGSGRLVEAEALLPGAEHASVEPDVRHTAEWHLAMAEFFQAVAHYAGGDREVARKAVAHAEVSLRHAAAASAVAIRVSALRLLGHAHSELDDLECAVKAWAEAHRIEESVAALQPSDQVRLRMLHAVPTEFDERVRWACDQAGRRGGARVKALVVIAMEAARGAQILPDVQPDGESARALPEPGDVVGARRWLRRALRGMPRSQAVWMLHATRNDVHHVLVRRTSRGVRIHHESRRCDRHRLISTIDALAECWQSGRAQQLAEARPGTTEFDRLLAEVAGMTGVPAFLDLPERVTRIAVVAGGELSDIPFALLPCPGADGTLIGRRFALSSLPCLALRTPLHRRSRRQRGTRAEQMLVLHGPDRPETPSRPRQPITAAACVKGRLILKGEDATATGLRDKLRTGDYRMVRIDSHGSYRGDPSRAALFLEPAGEEGRLTPKLFQEMDFSRTGTLALGACETGMAKRIGRDEQTGFVRAAFVSGASGVLAARWETLDDVAARVLDLFEQLLDRYPRDVALFHAQRVADTADGHPTRWAALNLYGATDYQTHDGPLVRWLRRRRRAAVPTPATGSAPTPGEQR